MMEEVEEEENANEDQYGDINTAFEHISFNYDHESEESGPCDSKHLLLKNTDSFRCLTQVIVSSSSLFKQERFLFPPLEDPGIDEVFNFVEPESVYDDIGVANYLKWCKNLEIIPISRVVKSLPEDTLNLKYYGITQKQMEALTETLKRNTHVQNIILQDNWLTEEQSLMLCNMIEENTVLRVLNLKECRIGPEGAEHLNEALTVSQCLTHLDLSYNSLGNKGILRLQSGLCDTPSLVRLNLSHNELTEDCAVALERMLIENKSLEELDLSWNGFYTGPGNKKLCNGLLLNDRIKRFSLAWNGIGLRRAAVPLRKYINRSQTLEYLDLTGNRMKEGTFKVIRTAINKNHSLIDVKVGNNPLTPEDAYSLANVLAAPAKANDPLKHLDMENIYFKKEVVPLLVKIQAAGRTIRYGGIIGNFTIKGPNVIELLFKRCRYILMKPKKKKKQKDFGHFILRLPDNLLTKDAFLLELKKQKIKKLDQDLINELCNRYVAKKKIDCPAMTKAYMELYPDTCLPPPKPKKQKKRKKGKKRAEEKLVAVIDLETPAGTDQQQGTEQQQPAVDQRIDEQQAAGQQATKQQQDSEQNPDQQ